MKSGSSPPSMMAGSSTTKITDLDDDAFAQCARYLCVRDVSNMAVACKSLRRAAYSDSVWMRFFRERWPNHSILQSASIREAYFSRQVDLHKFKYVDPSVVELHVLDKPLDHVLLDKDNLVFSEGSTIQMMQIRDLFSKRANIVNHNNHNARITCMRVHVNGVLRGHNGPVTTLSDNLLGDGSGKVFASGGEDGTLRIWSINSSGKGGQHGLKATLYGHQKPIRLISVAGHKTSLLASVADDCKVMVWDVAVSSSSTRSSCLLGTTSLPGSPVSMKCHDSLLYVAAGSSVVAIDLRTMRKVIVAAVSQPKVKSFAILPSRSLLCIGGDGKAMLWDIRRNQSSTSTTKAITEMDGHDGPITLLHMDQYKIVTGGPEDSCVNVYETETGVKCSSLKCCPEATGQKVGCSAMAVKGFQLVTASHGHGFGCVRLRDFSSATSPILKFEGENTSKFWNLEDGSESNEESDGMDYEDGGRY